MAPATAGIGAALSSPRVPAKVPSPFDLPTVVITHCQPWVIEFTTCAPASRLKVGWIKARVAKRAGVTATFSNSLARRRLRPNQEQVCSTPQRRGICGGSITIASPVEPPRIAQRRILTAMRKIPRGSSIDASSTNTMLSPERRGDQVADLPSHFPSRLVRSFVQPRSQLGKRRLDATQSSLGQRAPFQRQNRDSGSARDIRNAR